MPTVRRAFSAGMMDKDTDERLLPNGVYRNAINVNISTSEGADEGTVENLLSTKKLTNINFGENARCVGGYSCSARKKLYYFNVSLSGAFLIEYDVDNKVATKILEDTRIPNERVLNLNKNNSITSIRKIIGNKIEDDLLLWTDNNMEVCCINIERAKTLSKNGFTSDDIYLIKKPPLSPPQIKPLSLALKNNDLEENFFSFSYRYQYLDGEYSALSPLSKYIFSPKKYDIDYFELINKGMVNQFNAVRITFNTGAKQVLKIQICFKKSNSNNIYLIETFDKEKEGWGNDELKSINFTNNKIYKVLPEKELYRLFDNIPRRAKALDIIGNRIVLGDYIEGYNMTKRNGKGVKMNYSLSTISYTLDLSEGLTYSYVNDDHVFTFNTPPGMEYKEGASLFITIIVKFEDVLVYDNTFQFILIEDYSSLFSLVNSNEFQTFTEFINIDFQNHYNENSEWEVNPNYELHQQPEIIFSTMAGVPRFYVSDIIYYDTSNGNIPVLISTKFYKIIEDGIQVSPVFYSEVSNSESCKTNQSYSVGIIYRDDYGRASTVQTTDKNTIFIPQSLAINKNKIKLAITHEAPYWATNFKVALKTDPLNYQIIYINEFYNEGVYVWAKLENANKDKVKSGDFLNVKIAGGITLSKTVKIKVLDIQEKENNFIEFNETQGEDGVTPIQILEPNGLYMKIRPNGFSMDGSDFKVYQDEAHKKISKNNNIPVAYMSLFSEEMDNEIKDLSVETGSSMDIWIESKRDYKKSGWHHLNYEKTFIASRDYDSIENWINEELLGGAVYAEESPTELKYNIRDDLKLVRGVRSNVLGVQQFTHIPNGKLYLEIRGHYSSSPSKDAWVTGKISLRNSSGIYVFESGQKKIEQEVFFELPETYEVNAGNHIVTNANGQQDQFLANNTPAIVELSFFNCYSQGNGVESYKIKDDFNTNSLNIDSRPSLVSNESFREIHRHADLTYSEPYIESSNINGLNEFNASTANWKELNKQDGPIQIIYSRDGNLLVIQKNKWGYVLFGKDLLYNADGTTNVSSIPEVLGAYVPYAGEYGISDPESFAAHGIRAYGVDKEKGVVLRLSQNGLTAITKGMKDWFRDKLYDHRNAKVIGGFDTYMDRYQITIGEKPTKGLTVQCGSKIIKNNLQTPFSYIIVLNNIIGEVQIEYEVVGSAILTAEIGGVNKSVEVNTGLGDFTFQRTSLEHEFAEITIIPYSNPLDIELTNVCPIGKRQEIKHLLLADNNNLGQTFTSQFKINNDDFYSENIIFTENEILISDVGIEGREKFMRGHDNIIMQVMNVNNEFVKSMAFGYYLSDKEIDTSSILKNMNRISVNEQGVGSFTFPEVEGKDIIYLIWDFRHL